MQEINGIKIQTCNASFYDDAQRADLCLFSFSNETNVSLLTTRHKLPAAPIILSRQHLGNQIRAMVINTGCANAGTGKQGLQDALSVCELSAQLLNCRPEQVLPFSTGLIGSYLKLDKFKTALAKPGLPFACSWQQAATAIMTTDSKPKLAKQIFSIENNQHQIIGIAKGAGMIHPNMATMLSFIATDICIPEKTLQRWQKKICKETFNAISVDGDTSTNDAFVLISTNKYPCPAQLEEQLYQALHACASELAMRIISEGEGANKILAIKVRGGVSHQQRINLAQSIATSSLIKTALHGSDPNFGRIFMAMGNSSLTYHQLKTARVFFAQTLIISHGRMLSLSPEQINKILQYMQNPLVEMEIRLSGNQAATSKYYTCDLSEEYIKINSQYST